MIGRGGEPEVSIVTVTYNSTEDLPACIESVGAQDVPVEIFLVDNASTDGTPALVESLARDHENVHAIVNRRNHGLAYANNQVLGRTRGEFVLILNPDTVLKQDTLALLVKYLARHPDVSVVGPKNVYPDGRPHSSYHRGWSLWHLLLWRILPYGFTRRMYDRYARYAEGEVLFVSGACLLIRGEVFERIGGYDPQYFLTVEDVCDLCIRARRAGGRVVYYPEAEVTHLTGRSGAGVPFLVGWEGLRGSVYHFGKHHGVVAGAFVTAIFLTNNFLRAIVAILLSPFRSGFLAKAGRYWKLSWKLLAENPMLERNHHRFS